MLVNKIVILISLFSAVAYAGAGPTISVKVKNVGTVPIYSTPTGVNDSSTQLKSSPTPIGSIPPGSVNGFSVNSPYANSAAATFTYTAGKKKCAFATAVTILPPPLLTGTPTVSWTKSGTSTGLTSAVCQATITSVDFSGYSYSVEFTMK
mgnify:FL=1